jgi:hypothetical protein
MSSTGVKTGVAEPEADWEGGAWGLAVDLDDMVPCDDG